MKNKERAEALFDCLSPGEQVGTLSLMQKMTGKESDTELDDRIMALFVRLSHKEKERYLDIFENALRAYGNLVR